MGLITNNVERETLLIVQRLEQRLEEALRPEHLSSIVVAELARRDYDEVRSLLKQAALLELNVWRDDLLRQHGIIQDEDGYLD